MFGFQKKAKKAIKGLEGRVERYHNRVLALEEEIGLLQEVKRLKDQEEALTKKRDDIQNSI